MGKNSARTCALPNSRRRCPNGHFLRQFGQSDRQVIENASTDSDVTQVLSILNGHVEKNLTSNGGADVYRVIKEGKTDEEKIERMFMAILTRRPTPAEAEMFLNEFKMDASSATENCVAALSEVSKSNSQLTVVPPLSGYLAGRRWGPRHGTTPNTTTDQFANWLVPGVGAAPVTMFRVLLTAFVLAIGPVNYWVLRSQGRLNLLVVTAPLLAVAFTATLLLYALIADGLGARVRVRSVTTLDRSGEATTWSRLSYYAGLAPSGGLVLPDDTQMYPIHQEWSGSFFGQRRSEHRTMTWTDDAQRLRSGWLPSRTPTQYLQLNSRPTDKRIALRSAGPNVVAANTTGATLRLLVARDGAGAYWLGVDCETDTNVRLEGLTPEKAIRELRDVLFALEPSFPVGADDPIGGWGGSRRGQQSNWDGSEISLGSNQMNKVISHLLLPTGGDLLKPGDFVAVSEQNIYADLGIPNLEEAASCHIVVGEW